MLRGDVRQKWFEWWKQEQAKQQSKHSGIADELVQGDADNMWTGLQDFLAKSENRAVISKCSGWALLAKVIEIERIGTQAAESCWIYSARRCNGNGKRIRRRRATGSEVASKGSRLGDESF